MQLIRNNDQQ